MKKRGKKAAAVVDDEGEDNSDPAPVNWDEVPESVDDDNGSDEAE